jgi:HrpA-like RNA helicase
MQQTLEDVVVVIDGGRHKERRFDPHKRWVALLQLQRFECALHMLC